MKNHRTILAAQSRPRSSIAAALGRSLLALLIFACALPAAAQTADLVVNQSDSPDPGPAGAVFTYTVRIDNNGPGAATGVMLSDTLPAGATFVGATPTQGTCTQSGGVVTCNIGAVAFLGSATVSVQVRLPAAGVYTNHATATASTSDPNTTNNLDITEDTTAQVAADMTLTVVDSPDPVAAGQAYSYTVTATNQGPDPLAASDQQTVSLTVPAGACITALPTGTGWSCTPPSGYPLCSGAIACTRTGALGAGASAPPLTFPAVANVAGTITAAFQVGATLPDGNPADNTVTAQTTVLGGSSDVAITKTAAPAVVALGGNVTFTLTPRHNGGEAPGAAGPITVTDTLAAGLTYVSSSGAGWTCAFAAPTVTCTRPGPFTGGPFANMPPITIVATVSGLGSISNTAVVAIPETDPVPANNSATAVITGSNSADLQVTKTATLNPVVPNQDYNYTITVRNLGPVGVPASNTITVSDTLDAATILRAAPTGTGWACTPNAGFPIAGPVLVTCTRSAALASATNAPPITIPVRSIAAASITNTACASMAGPGPGDNNAANDCGTVTVASTAAQADLRVVSKTVSPDPVFAGQDVTYVITVTNDGPDPATNATVSDTLGALVGAGGFQSATPSQGACVPAAATAGPTVNLSCNLGTLNLGSTATVTVVVRPSIAVTGNRTNTATINSPDVGDPLRTNNTGSVTSVVTAVADLQASKTATPSPVRAGTPLTYVITARNNGPSTAQTVTATDTLPGNAAFIALGTVTGSGNCVVPAAGVVGGTVTCTWASIATSTQQTASFTVRPLTSAGGGTVSNTVHVASATADFNGANDNASTTTPVTVAQLDVLVNKVDSVDPVALGQMTTYTVTVTNAGPSFATNVVLVDQFPTGAPTATFSYQGALTVAPAGIGTCVEPALGVTTGTLTCTFPGLANGQSAIVTYDMRAESIASGISGTSFNTATVTVAEPDSLPGNNASTNATTSRRTADLQVIKTAPAAATPGTTFSWSLQVTNNGPNDSVGAIVSDPLPAGVTFVSASPGCVQSGGTVTCTLGTVVNGASATRTITVRVDSPYGGAPTLVNQATVTTTNEVDPVAPNNTSSASTTIGAGVTDLSIVKTGPPTVQPNGALTYTLTIANAGPSAADGASFTDTLPPGVTVVSATCGNALGGAVCGSVSTSAGSVTGTAAVLPAGGSVTVTIGASAPPTGPIVNSASVAPPPGVGDPNPANNTGTATTTVAPVDLAIAKSHAGTFIAGQGGYTYTLLVTNVGGPASSGLVTVTDTLPAGISATSIAGTGWTCTLVPLACTRSDPLSGAAAYPAITIGVSVAANAGSSLVNTATVSGGNDSNPANNVATDSTLIAQPADLAIAKSHGGTLQRGQSGVPYTIVVSNVGAGPTVGSVTVTDTLPAGLTARSIAGAGWSCTMVPLACTRGDALAPGGTYPPIVVVVDVSASASGTLVNQANVSGGGDANPVNDSASDSGPVGGSAVLTPIPTLDVTTLALLALALALAGLAAQRGRQRARRP